MRVDHASPRCRRDFFRLACLLLGTVFAASNPAGDHPHHPAGEVKPAPGYAELPYPSPDPGSYTLPIVRAAGDGAIREDTGQATSLHALFNDRLVVLGFIFTHCADPNGCPLASYVMRQIGRRVAEHPALRHKVRLISLSFDPIRDTPARLAAYATSFRAGPVDWRFVTTDTERDLAPILGAYGQSLLKDREGGAFSHQLRVFLIDERRNIRNEYSTAFLHADTVIADLTTLTSAAPVASASACLPPLLGAGDDKQGYDQKTYRTHSRALETRCGSHLDLAAQLHSPPLGLPPLPLSTSELPNSAQVNLGRRLFFERRLSHNNTLSCASCHVPDQGFTHHEVATPVGMEGRTVKRNAPSLYNVVFKTSLFHDSREVRLEQQVWSPLLAFNEMANPSIGYVLEKLRELEDYAEAFDTTFPSGLTQETLGAALAAYQRGLVSGNSAFDRWHFGGEASAVSADVKRGFDLFTGKAGCSGCHRVGDAHALFTDHNLHNTGIGYARSMGKTLPIAVMPTAIMPIAIMVGPGTTLAIDAGAAAASSEAPANDLGRYEVTLKPADRWKYRTPILRNVALSAPYMHDGSLPTLSDVLAFYNAGGIQNEGLDARLKPLHLSAIEVNDLLEFLKSLTGDNIDVLTRDAFAQPIGDNSATGLP